MPFQSANVTNSNEAQFPQQKHDLTVKHASQEFFPRLSLACALWNSLSYLPIFFPPKHWRRWSSYVYVFRFGLVLWFRSGWYKNKNATGTANSHVSWKLGRSSENINEQTLSIKLWRNFAPLWCEIEKHPSRTFFRVIKMRLRVFSMISFEEDLKESGVFGSFVFWFLMWICDCNCFRFSRADDAEIHLRMALGWFKCAVQSIPNLVLNLLPKFELSFSSLFPPIFDPWIPIFKTIEWNNPFHQTLTYNRLDPKRFLSHVQRSSRRNAQYLRCDGERTWQLLTHKSETYKFKFIGFKPRLV